MYKNFYPITFIIPTLNSAYFIERCLQSIREQNYPKEKIEILIVDGGSTDQTLEIAKRYFVRIIKNKRVFCEPGVVLGMKEARGKLCVIMGADNSLVGNNWIEEIIKPFSNPSIFAAYPKLINKKNDSWFTKYVNTFTDPFNHFVYGYANNPTTFNKVYKTIEKGENYEVYDFSVMNHPILAFDQGFTIRKEYGNERPIETEFCDILPVVDIIAKKKKIAYVYTASNYHATLNFGIKQFWKKQKWAIDNGFVKKPYGFIERRKYLSLKRKIKQYLWPFYSISFVFPFVYSFYYLIKDKEKYWLYHPFISFISGLVLWIEVIRIKIFKRKPLSSRQ